MTNKSTMKKFNLNLNQVIIFVYLSIILIGAVLLALPLSTKGEGGCGFLTALFTSTSAVCVTGLSLVDVWTTFSFFGQLVLLLLMQVGGLGFMSFISIFFHLMNHREGIQSLSLSAESLGIDSINHIKRIQKRLIIGSFLFESAGAVVLWVCFIPSMGIIRALWFGIFHAVSAFCNAGFDLMGFFSPGSGLTVFQQNPAVLIVVAVLIITGGIGFIVWDDIAAAKSPRNWSVYTRMVVFMTLVLLLSGMLLFLIFEFDNPDTMMGMPIGEKIINAFFQSVTPRTAGFASIDQSLLSPSSIALTSLLMIIGGSSGSTAGGIKTVTFLILIMSLLAGWRGKKHVILFQRTITDEQIRYAFTVTGGYALISIMGGFLISLTSDAGFDKAFFESISALATVGLSLGITSDLSEISCIIVIILMYLGRVGLLTLTLGFLGKNDEGEIKYPACRIMIG